MATRKDIEAKAGLAIFPTWKKLLKFIDSTGVVAGPGIRVSQGPNGTQVVRSDSFQAWNHPFKVSTQRGEKDKYEVIVTPGTLNTVQPNINGTQLDGLKDGNIVPVTPLSIEAPGSDGYAKTFIILEINVHESADRGGIQINPEELNIAHVEDIGVTQAALLAGTAIDTEKMGQHPLAALYWKDGKVEKVIQMTYHNLGHRYLEADQDAGKSSRHLVWSM